MANAIFGRYSPAKCEVYQLNLVRGVHDEGLETIYKIETICKHGAIQKVWNNGSSVWYCETCKRRIESIPTVIPIEEAHEVVEISK